MLYCDDTLCGRSYATCRVECCGQCGICRNTARWASAVHYCSDYCVKVVQLKVYFFRVVFTLWLWLSLDSFCPFIPPTLPSICLSPCCSFLAALVFLQTLSVCRFRINCSFTTVNRGAEVVSSNSLGPVLVFTPLLAVLLRCLLPTCDLGSQFLGARTTRGEDSFFHLKSMPLKVILAHSGTASSCPGDRLGGYADHFETQATKTLAVLASAATTIAWLDKIFGLPVPDLAPKGCDVLQWGSRID